jgi:hypothetical protein
VLDTDECPFDDGDLTIDLTTGANAFARDILRANPNDPRFSGPDVPRMDIYLGPEKKNKR